MTHASWTDQALSNRKAWKQIVSVRLPDHVKTAVTVVAGDGGSVEGQATVAKHRRQPDASAVKATSKRRKNLRATDSAVIPAVRGARGFARDVKRRN